MNHRIKQQFVHRSFKQSSSHSYYNPMRRGTAILLSSFLTVQSFTGTASFLPKSTTAFAFASTTSIGSSTITGMSATTPIEAPYGTWNSPITSKAITSGSVGISSLKLLPPPSDDPSAPPTLLWLESRSQEAGRNVLCRYAPNDPDRSERNAVDVSPKESNIRTRVHEYGGGATTVGGADGTTVYFSEFATQRVVPLETSTASSSSSPGTPLTVDGGTYRFADGVYDPHRDRLLSVREDHTEPAPADVVNEIVSVAVDGSEETTVLATGNDFYSAPRLSPDGKKLAYFTWNHPDMPWDGTRLMVTEAVESVEGGGVNEGSGTEGHRVVAGVDDDTSVLQPLWHPTTGDLFYISDESGFYNIYRDGMEGSVLPMEVDFGGSAPGWRMGQQGFTFLPDGRMAAVYTRDGCSRLVVANVGGEGPATDVREYGMEDGLPMIFGGITQPDDSTDAYFIGGSTSTPSSVYKWSLPSATDTTTPTCAPATVLATSTNLSFPPAVISTPRAIEFPTTDSRTAFGYYYPPHNADYAAPSTDTTPPPLLVKAHGGPTACTGTGFNPMLQYWTSRGFAVLDVDYGGSTGYGRDYRRRLRGAWGIVDVDDVCAGANYLVDRGLADPKRLCIDGGSAGGFTTLAALAFRKVFTAGCSLYGVADLAALAGDTHKFESRYLDGLVGRYPEDEGVYKERSPIESVDTLDCPILLLQGDEDKIVPPNQAKMMHEALLEKGIPTCLKVYEGEQHGFRKAENIEDALDSELSFFRQVFGIAVEGEYELSIDNMDKK